MLLILPAAVDVTGISIFMASTIMMSSPLPTLPPMLVGIKQTRPATSVFTFTSAIQCSCLKSVRQRRCDVSPSLAHRLLRPPGELFLHQHFSADDIVAGEPVEIGS